MAVVDAPDRGHRPSRIRVVTALVLTMVTLGVAAGLGTAEARSATSAGNGGTARSGGAPAGSGSASRQTAALPLNVRQTISTTFTFPGAAPQLAWPARGQAAMSVVGLGSLGTSGPLNTPVPIASITKTMTAYLILQDHPLADGQNGPIITITASQAAVYDKEAKETDDSLVPVKAGEQLTERDALYALMLASADNMAQVLAEWDAGSVSAFLAKMNTTAAELGMRHTRFTDPSGLAASTTSTAQDLVILGETVMQWADFREIVATRWAVIPVAGLIKNYNALLGTAGVIGIKTGSTSEAGSCLLFAASVTVGGQAETVVGAVLGQYLGTGKGLLTSAMNASAKLVSSGEKALGTANVAMPGTALAAVDRGDQQVDLLTVDTPVTVIGWAGLSFQVLVAGEPTQAMVTVSVQSGPALDQPDPVVTATDPTPGPTTDPASAAVADAGSSPVATAALLPLRAAP